MRIPILSIALVLVGCLGGERHGVEPGPAPVFCGAVCLPDDAGTDGVFACLASDGTADCANPLGRCGDGARPGCLGGAPVCYSTTTGLPLGSTVPVACDVPPR